MVQLVAIEFEYFERTSPFAFPAVRAEVMDDGNPGLSQVDAILRADADAATA